MKASDLLVKCLEEEGIKYIFGIPGEENADFIMSLERSHLIQFILTRHEQGAAFMAEVYGRLTGNPAGCLATLGPGATNLITGVADSNMDRAPMIVLTGQGSTRRLHKESHQIMDVVGMFKPVTKWATTILHPDNIPEIVRKAVRLARGEKPGAVLIELPENVAKENTNFTPLPIIRYRRPRLDVFALDQAMDMLLAASSPIIIAGNGCIRTRASDALRELCNLTGIGVMSTFMAKGAVDMDDDYCLFTIGLSQKDIVTKALDAADVVLTIGFDMVEYHPELWNSEQSKRIIHADFVPSEIDRCFQPEVELIGDVASTIKSITDEFKYHGIPEFEFRHQRESREEMLEEINAHHNDMSVGRIKPQKMLSDLRKILGPEDVLLSDVGAHKMWIARHYHCHEPNTCLIPNGFCSMGFSLPGAIAACIVHPDRNVVAITGDGGFLMNVQEMETAARLGCSITVIVWEDCEYGLIAWKQEAEFGFHSDLKFNNPEWLGLAACFGWGGYRVESSGDLEGVLRTAIEDERPSLVTLPIDYRENKKLTERLGEIECSF